MTKNQHSKQSPSAPSGKKVPVLCAAVLVLTALTAGLRAFTAPFPRLEVAGHRVTQEEYLRAMYQARNDVLSDHAAAGISLTDWRAETALGDPRELTMERALELLTQYYAVSTLAVERGYLADAGFDAMVRDMEEVNRQRQEALGTGAMVTGIPQFTLDDYMTYRASNLRLQFCGDPNNPENQVTAEELRQRYETDKANLYALPDDLELSFLVIDTSPQEAQTLKSELETLRQLALELGGLAPALEEHPQLKEHYAEITVDRGSYSVYARSHGDILLCAEGLQTGDVSQVFQNEGWLCLVECRQRITRNYAPLEDVQSIVLQSIRESRYDALIAQRAEEMEIDADLQALYRFTAKQFH
ncbi:MAG: hypothetical protein E7451_08725 [Ruminococcaceae bacterium]|nr:hypothetical protein [Oscillospiraceae bacterium]